MPCSHSLQNFCFRESRLCRWRKPDNCETLASALSGQGCSLGNIETAKSGYAWSWSCFTWTHKQSRLPWCTVSGDAVPGCVRSLQCFPHLHLHVRRIFTFFMKGQPVYTSTITKKKGKGKKKTFSEKENDSYQSHIQEIWYRYLIFEISEVGCTWHSCYCPVATPTPHTALGEFFFWVWSEGEFIHWPLISLLLSVSQSATLWAVTGGGCKLHQVRLVFITSSSVQHDQGWMDWWKEREEKRQRKKARKGKENGDGMGRHGKGREESHVLS